MMKVGISMFNILQSTQLSSNTFDFWLEAPRIATHAQAGQFVILRIDEKGERIPLTIAETNPQAGSIRIIFQVIGKTTAALSQLKTSDSLLDVTGPLGMPTEVKQYGTVMVVGGGVGIAAIYPIIKALKEAGNRVITILGARTAELVLLQEECRRYSDELIITTDDGSLGKKGLVTEAMEEVIARESVACSWAIGPSIMMKFCTLTAEKHQLPIYVSLNPIMIDGTGMCGGCRVTVDGTMKFACVDGPEFKGNEVNWDEFINRMKQYQEEEAVCFTDRLKEQVEKMARKSRIKTPIAEQAPTIRKSNFEEVCLGYTLAEGQEEAVRCLQCKNAPCIAKCPVMIDIPGFILAIREGNMEQAADILSKYTNLPAICGRVCPQEKQCEQVCKLGKAKNFEPVAIGKLERLVADWALENHMFPKKTAEPTKGKVAVVGSGPSGLTVAGIWQSSATK